MIPRQLLPVILKQVTRHRTRSGLTIAGIAAAMLIFSGISALQAGVETATQRSATDTTLIVYRKDRYCPATSRMPQHYAERISRIPGVASVVPMRIVVNNCKTSLDVVTFRGVPEDSFVTEYAPRLKVVAGSLDDWRKRSDGVLLGKTLAQRRRLKPGDRFDAAGITVYVAGIVDSDEAQHQNVAYAHLSFLQYASGGRQGGFVTQFNVRVTKPEDLDRVATAIDTELATDSEPTQTRSEQAFVAGTAKDILQIVAFTKWLGYGCLAAVLALVGNAIFLAVQQRVREHAVLQTLGFGGGLISRMILTEGVLLSVAGGFVGSIIALTAIAFGRLSLSVEGVSIPIELSSLVFVKGLLVSGVVGVLAGLAPAVQAYRRDIVDCFRAV